MLKVLRISSFVTRPFTTIKPLIANPKKLQKSIEINKSTRWLHKDAKLSIRKGMAVLSEEDLEKLSQRAISSSLGNSTIDSLQNFCSEFVNRLGPESFQSFISKHEGTLTKLIYTPHYKAYLKSCFKYMKTKISIVPSKIN